MVGKSGASGERSVLVIASARSLPDFTKGVVPGTFSIMNVNWPPVSSVSAGAPPL